ncbi:hypothetical protein D3C83_20150 [compost metagenome]
MLRARGNIDVVDIATGLADQLETLEARRQIARDAHALLRQHQRLAARDLLDYPVRAVVGVGMNGDVVPFQLRERRRLAKRPGIIMYHRDLHVPPPSFRQS